MPNRVIVIVSGWNCARYVNACLNSLSNQTYSNWKAYVFDDASTDDTYQAIKPFGKDNRFEIYRIEENKGATYCRYTAMRDALNDGEPQHAIVVLLGLDDLLRPNALEVIANTYDDNTFLTYGNWVNERGTRHQISYFPADVIKKSAYRNYTFISTAPNTFRLKLINHLELDDLQIDGKWIENCTDVAYMWPALELSGGRFKVIAEAIYIYRQHRTGNTLARFGGVTGKKNVLQYLKSRPKKLALASLTCS